CAALARENSLFASPGPSAPIFKSRNPGASSSRDVKWGRRRALRQIRHVSLAPVPSRVILHLHMGLNYSLTHGTDCLQKSNYKEERCRKEVDALYECCNRFYQEKGEDASSVCCPKYDLLKLKIKQRSQETT
ncbi:Cx9C motif-containing protein 4, mitochondrial, partial [Paraphaeosphaeria minitans]